MNEQLKDLLLQALETEIGGVQVYRSALESVLNEELAEEWEKYLVETTRHEQVLRTLLDELGFDAEQQTPGRLAVRHIGESLVAAMRLARESGTPDGAELVACECVVLAETKDHANWELLSRCVDKLKGREARALRKACEAVEGEEDEHLYHTRGWCRELWIAALGMDAVLPPPEEEKDVKTAIGAARAEQAREEML